MSLIVGNGVQEARERVQLKRLTDLYEDIDNSIKVSPDEYPLVKEEFDRWCKDDSYFSDYDKYSLVKPGTVLIRLFRYEKQHDYLYKSLSKEKAVKFMLLPFARVIKAHPQNMFSNGDSKFKTGDIITIADSLCQTELNPEWVMWKDKMDKERPQPTVPEPAKFKGIIMMWASSRLVADKFNITDDDNYTFIRSETDFDLKYEY